MEANFGIVARSTAGESSPVQSPFLKMPGMARNNDSSELAWYLQVVWRHRWTASACFLTIFVFVLIGTLRQKRVYLAKGSVEIEAPQNPNSVEKLFDIQPTPDSYLGTQVQILTSATLTSRVMAEVFPASGTPFGSPPPSALLPRDYLGRLHVDLVRNTRMISVGFEDTDPSRAAQTVNTLMSKYLDGIQGARSEVAGNASDWLLNQLKETKAKLEQATSKLQHYEQEYGQLPVDTDANRGGQVDELREELLRARAFRVDKESLYQQVQSGDVAAVQSPLLARLTDTEALLREQSAQLAKKYGPNFPRVRQVQEQLDAVHRSYSLEQQRATSAIASEYEAAVRRETLMQRDVERREQRVNDTAQQLLQGNMLKREVELTQNLYDTLLQRLGQAGMSSTQITPSARIVDLAKPPTEPIRPNVPRNLALGFASGLTLAFGLAMMIDHLQTTFKNAEDVEDYLHIPLLGIIPAVTLRQTAFSARTPIGVDAAARLDRNPRIRNRGRRRDDGWFRLDKDGANCFEMSEALRNLRTSLVLTLGADQHRSILLTSAVPGEGKTTISSNLSIALAQLGKRVLLIDADLRRPRVHKYFSIPNDIGLSSYLLKVADRSTVVFPSDVPRLDVIPSGGTPQNPVELLSADRMRKLIQEARADYDFVVVDSPILINMADSRVLASYVDAIIVIVKSGSTPRKLVREACSNLQSFSEKVAGVVLNYFDRDDEQYSYAYGYSNASSHAEIAVAEKDSGSVRAGD